MMFRYIDIFVTYVSSFMYKGDRSVTNIMNYAKFLFAEAAPMYLLMMAGAS